MPRFVLVIVLALPAAVLGCSTGGRASLEPLDPGPGAGAEPGPAATRLAAAPAATAAAGSARTAVTASVILAGAPDTTVRGEGMIDFRTGRGSSRIDLSPILPATSADAAMLDTITDGEVIYIRSPLLDLLGPVERPWARIDPGDGSSPGVSAGVGGLTALPGTDARTPLRFLAGVEASSVEEIGSEEIGGVATTHLRGSVDLTKASAAAGLEGVGRSLTELGASRLTVDAYLDHDNSVRRVVYDHRLPPGWGDGSQRTEVEYFDFGASIDVELPPDDEVSDLSTAFGS